LLSKRLIEKGIVLLNEELLPPVYDEKMSDEDLPLRPISVTVKDVNVVSAERLQADMDANPEFGWPEKDRVKELMNPQTNPSKEVGMVVFDLIHADLKVQFSRGIELVVPVKKFGMKVDLEIGCGGKIDEGWIRFKGPLLRVWFVNETRKLHFSFMERPNVIPHLNVNADRGRGDFASMHLTETSTTLDDVVERVLCDFGPGIKTKSNADAKSKKKNKKRKGKVNDNAGSDDNAAVDVDDDVDDDIDDNAGTSWMGDALGDLVLKQLKKSSKLKPGSPLEIDLKNNINTQVDVLFGKPRPSATIRNKLKQLEDELKRAEEAEAKKKEEEEEEDKENNERKIANTKNNTEAEAEEFAALTSRSFCGFGASNLNNLLCGGTQTKSIKQ